MTAVSGEGRGDILCKSRGSQPDWNKNHDEQCDGKGMKCSVQSEDGRRVNLKMGDIVIKCKVFG